MIYRVTDHRGQFVTGALTRDQAIAMAEQLHRRDSRLPGHHPVHYQVVKIEQVFTTSTLEDAIAYSHGQEVKPASGKIFPSR